MGITGSAGGITEYWFPAIKDITSGFVLAVVDGELVWISPGSPGLGYALLDATNQPFTGAISATNLSGTNTGDQDLSGLAPIASPTFTGTATTPEIIVSSLTPTRIPYVDSDDSLTDNSALTFDGTRQVVLDDGTGKFAVGNGNTFTNGTAGTNSFALGSANTLDLTGTATNSFALGRSNAVTVGNGESNIFALGSSNTVSNSSSGAIGLNNTASNAAVAIGASCVASGSGSTNIGQGSTTSGLASVSIGQNNSPFGSTNINIGSVMSTGGTGLVAVGRNIRGWTSSNTVILGNQSSTAININANGLSFNNHNPREFQITRDATVLDVTDLGAEKVTNGTFTGSATGWTLGTGWAYGSNNATKNTDGTGTLSQAVGAVAGEYYYLSFSIGTFTAGTCAVSLGGASIQTLNANNSTATYVGVVKATTTGDLIFTPSNTSRFTIDTVSVKRIQGGSLNSAKLEPITLVAPTIAAGAGAGTSPTVTVTGSEVAGDVEVTTGTTPSASAVVATITFNSSAFANAPYVCLTPANAATALLTGTTMVYPTATTTTFVINAGSAALTDATAYKWNYHVIGRTT